MVPAERLVEAVSQTSDTGFRPLGAPTDRLLASYAILAGLALAFPDRPAQWPGLAALHLAAVAIGFGMVPLQRIWQALAGTSSLAARVHDWYPLLLVPVLYAELPFLNRSVHDGRYFDSMVQSWEVAIFGTQPSQALAEALPDLFLSEVLHLGYLSYYLIIFGPPLLLYLGGRRGAFRSSVFALTLTFVVHYLFFIWIPVQGPRYLFPAPGGQLAEGPIYRLTHFVLEAGSSRGAAFPSSHVGVAVAQCIVAWRYLRRWFPAAVVMSMALALGAMYGGFHYAVDAIAGAVLGGACALLALRYHERSGDAGGQHAVRGVPA